MRLNLIRTAMVAVALALAPAAVAWAQGLPENGAPTRAGTQIVNKATVTFTDANNNEYDPVEGEVTLTVAFVAGVEVAVTNKPQPKSPGTGNWIEYTFTNQGNDVDYFTVSVNAGAGITVTGFSLVHPDNATEADWYSANDFNNLLAQAAQHRDYVGNNGRGENKGTPDPNTSLVIYLRYDLDPDFDAENEKLEVEVGSGNDPDTKDSVDEGGSTLDPDYVYEIDVKAQVADQKRLPSANPGDVNQQYTAVFTVENKGSGANFAWSVTADPAANISFVGVSGTDLTSATTTSGTLTLSNGQTVDVTVTYTIDAGAAAGSTADLILEVVSQADNDVKDDDRTKVTVIRPSLSITKEAFANKNEDPLDAGGVVPGATIWYRITVENAGAEANGADATNVEIKDVLPSALGFKSAEPDASNAHPWQLSTDTDNGIVTITAKPVDESNAPRTMAPGEKAIFWIEVEVK